MRSKCARCNKEKGSIYWNPRLLSVCGSCYASLLDERREKGRVV